MSNTTIIVLKNSGTSGNIPSANNLEYGEVALNYSDGILFYKNPNNQVLSISGSTSVSNTANAAFEQANLAINIAIDAFAKANQQSNAAFKTIIANGISLVADSNVDTLTILTTNNISITADSNGDNLTFDLTTTGVVSGIYGNSFAIPVITVDSKGRVTFASTESIDPSIASGAFDKANAANVIASSAFLKANAANVIASGAFDYANSTYSSAVLKTGNTMTGQLIMSTGVSSVSQNSGSIVVNGGVGVSGNIYISNSSYYGFANTSNVSVAKIQYNAACNSIDFVFD